MDLREISVRGNGNNLWLPESLRWQVTKERIAEVLEMLGKTLRPMVDDLVAALKKAEVPVAPVIQAPAPEEVVVPAAPAPVPATPESPKKSRFWWLLLGAVAVLLVGMWLGRPSGKPAPFVPNMAGRGWIVYNETEETLEMQLWTGSDWKFVGSLEPNGYQRFPCTAGPNIKAMFRGEGVEETLAYSFRPQENAWYEKHIQKSQ